MGVRIDDARNDRQAAEIQHPGARAPEGHGLAHAAGECDQAGAHGQGPHLGAVGVHGVDVPGE